MDFIIRPLSCATLYSEFPTPAALILFEAVAESYCIYTELCVLFTVIQYQLLLPPICYCGWASLAAVDMVIRP